MAVKEASAQEILLEQLAKHVASLTAEQKAKEMAIKGLNDQMKMAEAALAKKLRECEAAFEVRRMELDIAIQPLEVLKAEVPRLRRDVAELQKEKINVASDIRATKGGTIKEIEDKVAKAAAKLAKIETAIQTCKEKVAGL